MCLWIFIASNGKLLRDISHDGGAWRLKRVTSHHSNREVLITSRK